MTHRSNHRLTQSHLIALDLHSFQPFSRYQTMDHNDSVDLQQIFHQEKGVLTDSHFLESEEMETKASPHTHSPIVWKEWIGHLPYHHGHSSLPQFLSILFFSFDKKNRQKLEITTLVNFFLKCDGCEFELMSCVQQTINLTPCDAIASFWLIVCFCEEKT